jgi:hypothetical protein
VAGGAGHGPGETEVGDLDAPVVGEQDVLGLDVAVDDAGVVGCAERGEHRLHDLQGLAGAEPALLPHQVTQGPARHVLHRQEHGAVVGALVVDGDDVGVGQPGGRLGLADEPGHELLVLGQLRMHHLDGDRAVEPAVQGEVDGGHAATRQPRLDVVTTVEHAPDQGVLKRRVHPASLRPARGLLRHRRARR